MGACLVVVKLHVSLFGLHGYLMVFLKVTHISSLSSLENVSTCIMMLLPTN